MNVSIPIAERDCPHCGTWNRWGGVGSRSNSSHLTDT